MQTDNPGNHCSLSDFFYVSTFSMFYSEFITISLYRVPYDKVLRNNVPDDCIFCDFIFTILRRPGEQNILIEVVQDSR